MFRARRVVATVLAALALLASASVAGGRRTPRKPEVPMEQREQGTLARCVYCTKIREGLGDKCPFCHGQVERFQPARMMSRELAQEEVLQDLFELGEGYRAFRNSNGDEGRLEAARELRDRLVGFRKAMEIYGFDLGSALEQYVRRLEDQTGLAPGADRR